MSVTVNVVGQTAVSVSVAASTSVSVVASGGIGPAGFITVPGTATLAFGTFQFVPGDGITVSTANGQFLISSYSSTAVSSLAPVQSVAGRTGSVVLQASDVTAGTFDISRIPTIGYTALSGVPTSFTPASHTHDAAAISSGVLSIARVPTISYTALSNTPATFSPSAHAHSTADVVAFTAAASAAAPVQSVQSRTGAVVLTRADITAAAEVHTHSTADVVGLTAGFSQVGHTHDAAAVTSGTLDIARIPVIGYTALSGVPSSFAPGAHTHSTTDIVAFAAAASAAAPVQAVAGRTGAVSLAAADVAGLANVATSGSYTSLADVPVAFVPVTHTHSTSDIAGYAGLPSQAGYSGPLVTDGTNATWTSRYSLVSPVLVQGAGMTFTRDTAAGEITIAFSGGTSGLAVGSATPQQLGVAAAGTSANASREDHIHQLPTVIDITAAAAVHTHDAAAIASGTLDVARIPTIGYTALSGVPVSFNPSTHTHDAAAIASGTIDAARLPASVTSLNSLTGGITISAGANVTVSTANSTITIAAGGGGGGSGSIVEAATPAAFPATGADETIYVATDTNRIYTWADTVYVELGPDGGSSGSGEDSVLRALFVPPAPTGVAGTTANAQSVVSWTAPTVLAQTPITDYVVQYSSDSGATWTTFADGTSTATSATVTGLTNGTAYLFRVAAVNALGQGAFSSASSAVTPAAGDALFANVSLLMHMDGSGSTFTDSSGSPKSITAYDSATQSTAQSVFGGKSLSLDGGAGFVDVAGSSAFSFGGSNGPFTIEFWMRCTGYSGNYTTIMTRRTSDWQWQIGFPNTGRYLNASTNSGGAFTIQDTNELALDTWYHVAWSYDGTTYRLYRGGVLVASSTQSGGFANVDAAVRIGAVPSGGERFSGYLDELRITKGSARGYTGATITIPSAAFPNS